LIIGGEGPDIQRIGEAAKIGAFPYHISTTQHNKPTHIFSAPCQKGGPFFNTGSSLFGQSIPFI